MATVKATKVGAPEQMPGIGDGQGCKVLISSYTWAAAPAAATVIEGPLVQSGSTIADVVVTHTGLGASGTLEIGYGVDPNYFYVSAAQTAGGVVRMNAATAMPLTLTTNDTVDVVVTAEGASATGTIYIIVYVLPRNS